MNLEERKKHAKLNAAWRAGEKIEGLLFRYNSSVQVTLPDGTTKTGWISTTPFSFKENFVSSSCAFLCLFSFMLSEFYFYHLMDRLNHFFDP